MVSGVPVNRVSCPVLVVILTWVVSIAAQEVTPAQRHQHALAALNRRDYTTAIATLTELVAAFPERQDWPVDLSRAYQRSGDLRAARAVLERVLEDDPLAADAAVLLAEMLAEGGRWDEIVALLEPLAISGGGFAVHHALAVAFEHLERPVDASWHYTRSTELNPAAVEDWRALATMHLRRGLPALAVRALEQVLVIEEGDSATHTMLARAYLAAGRAVGKLSIAALADVRVGSTCRDQDRQWYIHSAIEDEPNRFVVCPSNSAIYHIQRARETGADRAAVDLLEADIWFDAQELPRARALYRALETHPVVTRQAGYHERYARTLLELNDPVGYEKHMLAAVQLDAETYEPRLAEVYEALAQRYCLRGELDKYIQYLRSAVRESPRSSELHHKLAEGLAEAGRMAEAARHWQVTLQLEPDHPDRAALLERIHEVHGE